MSRNKIFNRYKKISYIFLISLITSFICTTFQLHSEINTLYYLTVDKFLSLTVGVAFNLRYFVFMKLIEIRELWCKREARSSIMKLLVSQCCSELAMEM